MAYQRDPLRVLIVDDERNARNRLLDLLDDIRETIPTIIVGEAGTGTEALKALEGKNVDVVLCDISMPEMDGLEFARHVRYIPNSPHVIFVTAYDDFAVKAFEVNAVDYLVKPVRVNRLIESLQKLEGLTVKANITDDFPSSPRRYFSCVELGKVILVPVHKVVYIKADDKYVVATTTEREYLVSETLSGIEKEFSDIFIRTHRSFIVAKKAIIGVHKDKNPESEIPYKIELAGINVMMPVSRRQWKAVKDYLKSLSGQKVSYNE